MLIESIPEKDTTAQYVCPLEGEIYKWKLCAYF